MFFLYWALIVLIWSLHSVSLLFGVVSCCGYQIRLCVCNVQCAVCTMSYYVRCSLFIHCLEWVWIFIADYFNYYNSLANVIKPKWIDGLWWRLAHIVSTLHTIVAHRYVSWRTIYVNEFENTTIFCSDGFSIERKERDKRKLCHCCCCCLNKSNEIITEIISHNTTQYIQRWKVYQYFISNTEIGKLS